MRAVVQRVASAKVEVDGKIVGEIKAGYFVLLGVSSTDDISKAGQLANKISKLRIMPDEENKMNKSLVESDWECLVVSQFTLLGDTRKGNRPSFVKSAIPEKAEPIYKHFINSLKDNNIKVETGAFGAYMNIKADLDGPTTIIYEI